MFAVGAQLAVFEKFLNLLPDLMFRIYMYLIKSAYIESVCYSSRIFRSFCFLVIFAFLL